MRHTNNTQHAEIEPKAAVAVAFRWSIYSATCMCVCACALAHNRSATLITRHFNKQQVMLPRQLPLCTTVVRRLCASPQRTNWWQPTTVMLRVRGCWTDYLASCNQLQHHRRNCWHRCSACNEQLTDRQHAMDHGRNVWRECWFVYSIALSCCYNI